MPKRDYLTNMIKKWLDRLKFRFYPKVVKSKIKCKGCGVIRYEDLVFCNKRCFEHWVWTRPIVNESAGRDLESVTDKNFTTCYICRGELKRTFFRKNLDGY